MSMTEKLKQTLNIPVWVVAVLAPVLIALLGFTINAVTIQQDTYTRIGIAEESIRTIRVEMQNKATSSEVKDIKYSLTRVEDKLDRLIERN